MAGIVPTILLHFLRPWRSDALMPRAQATYRDVGRYDSREGGGRVAPGAATESNARSNCRNVHDSMARIVPTIPLHFRHPWRSDGGRLQGRDCSQQSFCISTVPGGQMQEGTTPGKEEVELRQEQQPRATQATCKAGIVPNNPSAFPPSLAVRCRKVRLQGRRR